MDIMVPVTISNWQNVRENLITKVLTDINTPLMADSRVNYIEVCTN